MNKFFKVIEEDFISYVGIDIFVGEEITEEEYNSIRSIIDSKPSDTETHYYKLRADTLEYYALERPEPIEIEQDPYQQGYDQAVLDMLGV